MESVSQSAAAAAAAAYLVGHSSSSSSSISAITPPPLPPPSLSLWLSTWARKSARRTAAGQQVEGGPGHTQSQSQSAVARENVGQHCSVADSLSLSLSPSLSLPVTFLDSLSQEF